MAYLARLEQRPGMEELSDDDRRTLAKRFDANASEIVVDGQHVEWGLIDEVEVAQAAREGGPAGWFVKKVIFAGERYHVGVYVGQGELVLTNISLAAARFVVHTIAYYAANHAIRYTGTAGVAPIAEP